jgi:hypothetical protein
VVLVAASMFAPAPSPEKIAGLTFATVSQKLDVQTVSTGAIKRESAREHQINIAASLLLAITVIGLWVYFR